MAPSFSWWNNNKDTNHGTSVIVEIENPNWSMVELECLSNKDFLISKSPGRVCAKNAKQFTWVLLLRSHRVVGCLTSIGSAMLGLTSAICRRTTSGMMDTDADVEPANVREVENPTVRTRFYFCIMMFLWMSVLLLGFEVAAYFKGWHFGAPHLQLEYLWASPLGVKGTFDWVYSKWVLFRVEEEEKGWG